MTKSVTKAEREKMQREIEEENTSYRRIVAELQERFERQKSDLWVIHAQKIDRIRKRHSH